MVSEGERRSALELVREPDDRVQVGPEASQTTKRSSQSVSQFSQPGSAPGTLTRARGRTLRKRVR